MIKIGSLPLSKMFVGSAEIIKVILNGVTLYEKTPAFLSCLTFSSPSSFTLKTANTAKNWNGTLEYSTDESTWNVWDGTAISSGANNSILLRGMGNTYITNATSSGKQFVFTGSNISCNGNIMTLLDYQNPSLTVSSQAFSYLFRDCTNLTTAPQLPATTLASSCYANMFRGCTSLTAAPELPATTLGTYCYSAMFQGCTSLTIIPSLPATALANNCYSFMFSGCSKIKLSTTQTGDYTNEYRIPAIGTGTSATNALNSMFSGTGGSFTGTPTINTTYYTSNTIVPAKAQPISYFANNIIILDTPYIQSGSEVALTGVGTYATSQQNTIITDTPYSQSGSEVTIL